MRRMMFRFASLLLLIPMSLLVTAQDTLPTATPEPPIEITVWLPDALAAPDNLLASEILRAQTQAFASAENVLVTTRLKRGGAAGGIISTLRTASTVAPAALPTLTLLRRQDLVNAELDGLIQSLEGRIPSIIQGELDAALKLGQIKNELFGVPYLIDLQHIVYRPQGIVDYDNWNYAAILERDLSFVFPAGTTGSMSDVFLLQYLDSGGTMDADGSLVFNPTALSETLEFYEQARDDGLIDENVLAFSNSRDYFTSFLDRDIDIAVFSSTSYLQLYESDNDLQIAPIPSARGTASSVLNGWIWVLVATEPRQQEAGIRYINWLMNSDRQAEYARSVSMLPSQQSAFQRGVRVNVDVSVFETLLNTAILPITESEGGTLAKTMQEALIAVLSGTRTAEQATQRVVVSQSGSQ